MKLAIIVAIDKRYAIGYQNKLLYWLPNDLKRFKALTTGHTIVMGRKTFESLPKGALPNRRNVVVSHSGFAAPGAEVFPSIAEALSSCAASEEVYVIGGASVYEQMLPYADRLCITYVEAEAAEADAFFPHWSAEEWVEESREHHQADEKHAFAYDFIDYRRK